jgi:hypothetical protein
MSKNIFNQVWEGLVSQDFEITNGGKYRSLDETVRSPIGWLMTGEEFREFGTLEYGGLWLGPARLFYFELRHKFYDDRQIIYELEVLYHQRELANKIYGNRAEEAKLKHVSRYEIQRYGEIRKY